MKQMKKMKLTGAAALALILLAACGSNSQPAPSSSSAAAESSLSASQSSAASGSSAASSTAASSAQTPAEQAGELAGTYTASHEGDQLTLVISGNSGTLTTVEADGEQEIEQVRIDPTNQTMIIGDDVERYRIDGNQLTVEDLDQEINDRDTIIFSKQ